MDEPETLRSKVQDRLPKLALSSYYYLKVPDSLNRPFTSLIVLYLPTYILPRTLSTYLGTYPSVFYLP